MRTVEADASKRSLSDTKGFEVLVQASEHVKVGELIPLHILISHEAYSVICEEGYERPLYPSSAYMTDWIHTPSRTLDIRLPWQLIGDARRIHIFAFRSFGEFDALRYGLEKGELSCPILMDDYFAMFDEGMVARTITTIRVR
ncbi:hypothetical protein IT408_01240 [Candidatus Uhrbacteria bacterium]|nr:hypothetical protein [Candidatus Uhrbacteria bacterium]